MQWKWLFTYLTGFCVLFLTNNVWWMFPHRKPGFVFPRTALLSGLSQCTAVKTTARFWVQDGYQSTRWHICTLLIFIVHQKMCSPPSTPLSFFFFFARHLCMTDVWPCIYVYKRENTYHNWSGSPFFSVFNNLKALKESPLSVCGLLMLNHTAYKWTV